MKLSGKEWEGEAGWGAGSLAGAAGVIVFGGTRLPRNLIRGVRARRRRVGCMVVVDEVLRGRGRIELGCGEVDAKT